MRGRDVFYPMGWDDNGLPTERRVQNYFGVRCDPHLAVRPGVHAAREAVRRSRSRSPGRTSWSCAHQLVEEDEKAFEALWRRLGLSVDWSTRTRRSDRTRGARASARSCATSRAARRTRPTRRRSGTSTIRTAVAQAELEDREMPGAYHALRFHRPDGSATDDRHDTSRTARGVRRTRRASRRRALPAAVRHRGRRPRCTARVSRSSRTGSPIPRREPASR